MVTCFLLTYGFVTLKYDYGLFTPPTYAEDFTGGSGETSVKLSISGTGKDAQVTANRGGTAYREHTINVSSAHVRTYDLLISGDTELVYQGTGGNSNDKLTGVGTTGTAGNKLPQGTWGYAWDTNTSANKETMLYKTPPTTETSLLGTPKTINGTLNDSGKLAFAANFDGDKTDGQYTAKVNLRLTVVPQENFTYSITYNNNGGGTAPSAPASQSGWDKDYATFTLGTASERSGYTFLGWNTSQSNANAGTVEFNANATINICRGGSASVTCHIKNQTTVTLYAVWRKNIVYTLTYDANGGINPPAAQTHTDTTGATYHDFSVASGKPTYGGYLFLGWSTDKTALTPSYQAGNNFRVQSANPAQTLYAVWGKTIEAITYMQDMTADICKNTEIGKSAALIDTRKALDTTTGYSNKNPNNTSQTIANSYIVQKMPDGNCWMTQNLRLNLNIANVAKPADSDVSVNYPASSTQVKRTQTMLSTAMTAEQYADNQVITSNTYDANYGFYYSWCAATAKTCLVDNRAISSASESSSIDASSSICPKGWKMPKGSPTTSINNMIIYNDVAYLLGITKQFTGTPNFWSDLGLTIANNYQGKSLTVPISNGIKLEWWKNGYIESGLNDAAGSSRYWTRTAYLSSRATSAYALSIYSNSISPSDFAYWYYGFSIRCLAYSS